MLIFETANPPMEDVGITKNQYGLLTATERTSGPKGCAINLERRIGYLSRDPTTGGLVAGWRVIGECGKADARPAASGLCLCGHEIEVMYVVSNGAGVLAQIGSACVNRFIPGSLRDYKRSLIHPYHCEACGKDFANKDRHLESAGHLSKSEKFSKNRRAKLNLVTYKKAAQYTKSSRFPGECPFCGPQEDLRVHRKSREHIAAVEVFKATKLSSVVDSKVHGIRPFFESSYRCLDCPTRLDMSTVAWKPRCYPCYRKFAWTKG
jgi:hypothetical protein